MLEELLEKAAKEKKLIGSGLIAQILNELTALSDEDLTDGMAEFVPRLGSILERRISEIEDVDAKKATDLVLEFLPQIIGKIISSDEEIKNELAMTEDMTFNLKAGNILEMCVEIKGGKMSLSPGLAEERDFFVDVPAERFLRILSGDEDAMSGLMGGGIAMWREGDEGDMTKAISILPLITVVAEKLKLDTML